MGKIKNEKKIIEEVCKDILNGEKIDGLTVEAIVLTGSFVHGNIHEQSDIDIFVVVQEKLGYIRHIAFYKETRLIQLRICSCDEFINNCKRYERKRPAAYACKVLYDNSGLSTNVIEASRQFLDLGPRQMDHQQQEVLSNTIKNEMDTLKGLVISGNYLSAFYLIHDIIYMNIDYYNNKNSYWMANNNYLFSELKKHNEEMYLLIEHIILENNIDIKIENLKKLCKLSIEDYDELKGEYIYDEII